MATLRELIKDKQLPVRVTAGFHDCWFEIRYIYKDRAYGHENSLASNCMPLECDGWLLVEPPKPRLLAWRHIHSGDLIVSYEDAISDQWERVPHLDGPEE